MAFRKKIQQKDAGISADYWRVVGVHIDAVSFIARIVLHGYVSADIRQAQGRAIDLREYQLTPQQFGQLATAPAKGPTTFDAIASASYGYIAATPRAIPAGAVFDPETGELTIPSTGEVVSKKDLVLDENENPIEIPSEFRDAIVS